LWPTVMNAANLEQIELKIAFLERANHELSDVVYRQQRELDELHARLSTFAGRVDELIGQQRPYSEDEERPPHY
jgi:SlyX protein